MWIAGHFAAREEQRQRRTVMVSSCRWMYEKVAEERVKFVRREIEAGRQVLRDVGLLPALNGRVEKKTGDQHVIRLKNI